MMLRLVPVAGLVAGLMIPAAALADPADESDFVFALHAAATLTDADRLLAQGAEMAVLALAPGQSLQWGNSASGTAAGYAVLREGRDAQGRVCKEVQINLQPKAAAAQQAVEAACLHDDGWMVLK